MKKFKIEGWYRYNDEKDFEVETFNNCTDAATALRFFTSMYENVNFYKIDIKEIV